jgi:hypothetical protein
MNTDTPTQVDINEAMEYAAALKHCHDCFADRAAIILYDELTAVTEQRDKLAEALQDIKNELWSPAPVAKSFKIADEALQSLTTNEL